MWFGGLGLGVSPGMEWTSTTGQVLRERGDSVRKKRSGSLEGVCYGF